MTDHSSADAQILAILEALQETIGDDMTTLDASEVERVRAILAHGDTLVEIAKYEEAKGLFWAHWRGLILGAGAIISAFLVYLTGFERVMKAIAKGVQ